MDEIFKGQAQSSNSIFKSNISAVISIYNNSDEIRRTKSKEIEIEVQKWSDGNKGKSTDQIAIFPKETMEDYNLYQYHFGYLLLNALFISAFSLFEIHLKRLAKIAETGFNSNIKLSDIKGHGEIDTIRKYLFLIHELESANAKRNEWKEVLEFKAIRNAIVHHGNVLNPERKLKPENLLGFKKLKQHNIWMNPDVIYFRLKEISFLEDFKRLTINYSDSITSELTSGH